MRLKAKLFLFVIGSLQVAAFSNSPEQRISELEKQMLEVSTMNQMGTFGAKFASSGPSSSKGRWLVSLDVLLWKAKTGASEFAYSVDRIAPEGVTFPQRGTISEIDFGWQWGFKAGVGMQTTHDDWDIYLQYTRFKTAQSAGSKKDLPAGFLGLTGFLDPALSAKSSYKLSYNDLSLLLGKAYYLSSKFMTKPFLGIKNSWINQKQTSKYEFDTRSGSLISFSSQLEDRCKFWGIGPLAGFNWQFYLDGGFSLLSEVSVSLLYGFYKCEDFYKTEESRIEGDQNISSFGRANIKGSMHHFSPYSDFQIGLCYERSYNEDRIFFLCKLLYEAQYFFRQEDKINVDGVVTTGPTPRLANSSMVRFTRESEDVSFQGLTFRMELFF